MNVNRLLMAALLVTVAAAQPVRAQLLEDYRFQGKVVDQSGSPLAGVAVTLRDVVTGARIVFATGADGTFDRRMVPHAVYEASFALPGYVTRVEKFDWSFLPPEPMVKTAQVVLESQAHQAQLELGKKAAKLYETAYASLSAGDCDKATESATELLGLGAGSYEYAVRFVLARCAAMRGKLDEASSEYETVAKLKPDLFEAHFDLAMVRERQGRHDEALAEYAQAAALRPEDAEAQYNMGAILFNAKRFEEARPHLERAVALNGTHAEALKALGYLNLQAEKKDLAAAADCLRRYLALRPAAADTTQVRELVKALAAAPPPRPAK
jgi:tetratricopeptide (TPR) repeat protein